MTTENREVAHEKIPVKEWLCLGFLGLWLIALAPTAALGSEAEYRALLGSGTFWFFLSAGMTHLGISSRALRYGSGILFLPSFLTGILICGVGYTMLAATYTKVGFLVLVVVHGGLVVRAGILGVLGRSTPRSRYLAYGFSFAAANLHPLLASILYVSPSLATCEKVANQTDVEWLSPMSWLDDTAQANTVLWDDKTQTLVAPFKNASNRMLQWWNDPEGNFVMVLQYDANDDYVLSKVQIGEGALPEDVLIQPETQSLWTMSLTIGVHRHRVLVDTFRLSGRKPSKQQRSGSEFGNMFGSSLPGGGILLFGQQGEWGRFDVNGKLAATGEVPRAGIMIFDSWSHQETGLNYLTHVGQDILEFNLEDGTTNLLPALWGSGELSGSLKLNRLYHADVLFNGLNVFDLGSKTNLQRLELDYKPRPLMVADDIDLLFVGEWLSGKVHIYRLSTLEYLGAPIETGPYLRGLAVDSAKKRLFVGSKCGVGSYQIADKFL